MKKWRSVVSLLVGVLIGLSLSPVFTIAQTPDPKPKRVAVVDETGTVVNIALAKDGWNPGPGLSIREATGAEIGGRWDGTKYLPRPKSQEELASESRAEAMRRFTEAVQGNPQPWAQALRDLAIGQGWSR